jgi:hypothetical protein
MRRGLATLAVLALATAACAQAEDGHRADGAATARPEAPANSSPAEAAEAEQAQEPRMILRRADDHDAPAYASLVGEIAVTDANCVGIVPTPPGDGQVHPTAVIWPRGWSARQENGRATLYDATGNRYAREGDTVSLPGINGDSRYADHPCAHGAAPFKVNDDHRDSPST